jgi:hypothetical protein
MKRSILASLSILLLSSTTAIAVKAEPKPWQIKPTVAGPTVFQNPSAVSQSDTSSRAWQFKPTVAGPTVFLNSSVAMQSGSFIAETVPVNTSQTDVMNVPPRIATRMAVTPFNLVFLAFHGFFEPQGIPSSMDLLSSYRNQKITAVDLVKIAVDMNRLPQSALTDRGYLNAVNSQLEDLAFED